MNINILSKSCRLVLCAQRYSVYKNIVNIEQGSKVFTMAQRSITSFFKVTPPKRASVNEKSDKGSEEAKEDVIVKKSSKRARLSSSTESEVVHTPPESEKKKKQKRQRIESSESESEKSPDTEPTIKIEKTSPKTYQSPKNKKTKSLKDISNTKTKSKPSPKVKKTSPKLEMKEEAICNGDIPQKNSSPVKSLSAAGKEESKETKESIQNIEEVETIVPELEYDPAKAKYHPVRDACWRRDQPVPYVALARTLQAIEGTASRLRTVDILANYLRSVLALTPTDLVPSLYLCLNQLAPASHCLELGIAETYLMKAIGACAGMSLAQVRAAARAAGELAAVAATARAAQRTLRPPPPLTLAGVFAALRDVARMAGAASVARKIARIQALFVSCRDAEAKFLTRSLEGKLRVGLAEQSVLQALAVAVTLTPPGPAGVSELDAGRGLAPERLKARIDETALTIKTVYCECPHYEAVVGALLAHGVAQLPQYCRLTPGVPTKPMLAHPTKGVHEVFDRFDGVEFTCEWKYDGERAQIHVPGDSSPDYSRAAIFSRNQENNTSKYPDILSRLPALLKDSVKNCILDCEAVAYDPVEKQILPFQVLSTRKRKDAVAEQISVQVCVFVFDLLLLNDAPLVRTELRERRRLLREHFNEVPGEWQFAVSRDCVTTEEVQEFLEASVRGSCEGLMVKTLRGEHALYHIARRSRNWLKLKKDYLAGGGDSIDVVVLGGFRGRGRRHAGYGGFLCFARDPDSDCYQSLCKLGTGFTDDDLRKFSDELDQLLIDAPRSYYSYDKSHEPDTWFEARVVWEVRCADLSLSPSHRAAIGLLDPDKGVSLRFPRFVRVRPDKTPEEATSGRQIADMYLNQDQVKNQTNKPNINADDFY